MDYYDSSAIHNRRRNTLLNPEEMDNLLPLPQLELSANDVVNRKRTFFNFMTSRFDTEADVYDTINSVRKQTINKNNLTAPLLENESIMEASTTIIGPSDEKMPSISFAPVGQSSTTQQEPAVIVQAPLTNSQVVQWYCPSRELRYNPHSNQQTKLVNQVRKLMEVKNKNLQLATVFRRVLVFLGFCMFLILLGGLFLIMRLVVAFVNERSPLVGYSSKRSTQPFTFTGQLFGNVCWFSTRRRRWT